MNTPTLTPPTPVLFDEETNRYTIVISATIGADFLAGVMTTMVETAYEWFAFRKVKRFENLDVQRFTAHEIDCDDTGKSIGSWDIDCETVVKAIQRLASGGLMSAGNTAMLMKACADDDAGMIDADLADCILQAACFDEIRYG
jgi:hypothetical protein